MGCAWLKDLVKGKKKRKSSAFGITELLLGLLWKLIKVECLKLCNKARVSHHPIVLIIIVRTFSK